MKTLLVMRHAKSDWQADYHDDHDRPLNDRGVNDARKMGRVLTDAGLVPEHVISSTALRAKSTAELADEAGMWRSPIQPERLLYEAGVGGVLEVCAEAPEIDRMLIVGHQPTWSMLVAHLTGIRPEMKTAAVAVVEIPMTSWVGIADRSASLVELLEPRAFPGPGAET